MRLHHLAFLSALILALLSLVHGGLPLAHTVFSARHLRDLAFEYEEGKDQWVAKDYTLLILYNPKCSGGSLEKNKMLPKHLPPVDVISYLKYDYETFPKGIWYEAGPDENLQEVFKVKSCPAAIFIKKGAPMSKFKSWDSMSSRSKFETWFWDMMKTDIFIGSFMDQKFTITFEGPGPSVKSQDYGQSEGRNLVSYIGKTAVATLKDKSKQVVWKKLVDWEMPNEKTTVKNSNTKPIGKLDQVKKMIQNEALDKEAEVELKERLLQNMYIRTYKQPLMLGYMSSTGYRVKSMDNKPYNDIIDYITSESNKPQNESKITEVSFKTYVEWESDYRPWLHVSKTDTLKVLPMEKELGKEVGENVKDIVEKWVKVDVEMVKVDAVHYFSEGMYISAHVTVSKEAITAMVILEMETNGVPIEFQVVNYKSGSREMVYVSAGDIFMYESATLITALKKPLLKGQYFTAVYFRYRPLLEWNWFDSRDHRVLGLDPKLSIHESMDEFVQKIRVGHKPSPIDVEILKEMRHSQVGIESAIGGERDDQHESVVTSHIKQQHKDEL